MTAVCEHFGNWRITSDHQEPPEHMNTGMSRKAITFIATAIVAFVVALGYLCGFQIHWTSPDGFGREKTMFADSDLRRNVPFETNRDTLVPLWIPETGMLNFVQHVIHDSDISPPCQFVSWHRRHGATFRCVGLDNSTWLLASGSSEKSCGPAPDWTASTQCLEMKNSISDKEQLPRK